MALVVLACQEPEKNQSPLSLTPEFRSYWLNGVAEVSSYSLTQARYGKLHPGELVLIMVTEPFKRERQVKSELAPGLDDLTVLKAHEQRHFTTGIYDYTMTTSSFKSLLPEDGALKITSTSAEWCGHTFFQLNRRENQFRVLSHSYFEAEGDQEYKIDSSLAEDEIYQWIRLDPSRLPQKEITVIPSLISARLRHRPLKPERAMAELSDYSGPLSRQQNLRMYSLTYDKGKDEERQVSYIFEKDFPYRIVALSDEYLDGFQNPVRLKTTAVLKEQILIDYWKKNRPEDRELRKKLGL